MRSFTIKKVREDGQWFLEMDINGNVLRSIAFDNEAAADSAYQAIGTFFTDIKFHSLEEVEDA